MKPSVSVIIPAYNVSNYLLAALESVKNQTFEDFEAVIVDDGSTDNTYDIAADFCALNSRFKVVRKSNGGLSSARNYGIENSDSDYIALLDSDDIYHPKKIETHVKTLTDNPSVGVVYSASKAVRDDGRLTPMTMSGKPIYRDPLYALMCKNFVGHGSNAVFRRCISEEVGEFDETLRSSEDVDFWLRVAATRRWSFHRVPEILCYYRVRPTSLSFNTDRMRESRERVLGKAYEKSPDLLEKIMPTAYAYLYRYLARICLSSNKAIEAREFIQLSLKNDASIFFKDFRSLMTLAAVYSQMLSLPLIRKILG